ncbi:MAG: hypothetical protein JRI44_13625, partial [Deltaproteobacteria bacterium]|nr:hypothetical protein [Deltaproteobacteria bacterium]
MPLPLKIHIKGIKQKLPVTKKLDELITLYLGISKDKIKNIIIKRKSLDARKK